LRGKSIGGERNPPGDPAWLPQNGAGRSGARSREARDAPTSEKICSQRKNDLPGGPRNDLCLMIFARNALVSGSGMA